MKYVVQVEIDPDTGNDLEANPAQIQEIVEKFQALNPIGFYMGITRRVVTVIVDVPNEDAMFEALHATWRNALTYPEVWPVVSVDEFPQLLARAGIGP